MTEHIIVRAFQFQDQVILQEVELLPPRRAHIRMTTFRAPESLLGLIDAVEALEASEEASRQIEPVASQ
jgi:hypothetical protein